MLFVNSQSRSIEKQKMIYDIQGIKKNYIFIYSVIRAKLIGVNLPFSKQPPPTKCHLHFVLIQKSKVKKSFNNYSADK